MSNNGANANKITNLKNTNTTLFQAEEDDMVNAPTGTNYTERQLRRLCGKHAINHVLQEEKIVWFPKGAGSHKLFFGGTNPMDTKTKVNIHNYCRWRLNKIYRRSATYKFSRSVAKQLTEDDCNDSTGNFQANVLFNLFDELLKYKTSMYWPTAKNFDEIITDIEDHRTLGAVINVPDHWIAISRYFNGCHTGSTNKKAYKWALLDSLKNPIYKCGDSPKDLLKPLLDAGDIFQIIVVKDEEGAYVSEAVKRRTHEYNARFVGGTKRKTRRGNSVNRRSCIHKSFTRRR